MTSGDAVLVISTSPSATPTPCHCIGRMIVRMARSSESIETDALEIIG